MSYFFFFFFFLFVIFLFFFNNIQTTTTKFTIQSLSQKVQQFINTNTLNLEKENKEKGLSFLCILIIKTFLFIFLKFIHREVYKIQKNNNNKNVSLHLNPQIPQPPNPHLCSFNNYLNISIQIIIEFPVELEFFAIFFQIFFFFSHFVDLFSFL